jgi:hypothetical protein
MDENSCALIGIGERNGRHVRLGGNLRVGRIPDRDVFAELGRQPVSPLLDAQPVVFRMIAPRSLGFAHESDERGTISRRRWRTLDEHLIRAVGADLVAATVHFEPLNVKFPSVSGDRHWHPRVLEPDNLLRVAATCQAPLEKNHVRGDIASILQDGSGPPSRPLRSK